MPILFSTFVVKLEDEEIAVRKWKPDVLVDITTPMSRVLFEIGNFRFMDSTDKSHKHHYLILRFSFAPTSSRLVEIYEVKLQAFYDLCALHSVYVHTGSDRAIITLHRRLDDIVSQCKEVSGM